MGHPLVTVGILSYNNELYLRDTLESIRLQTYPHLELIVVDDASSDGSVELVEAWLAEYPEVEGQVIRHTANKGVCATCNDIVRNAKGEFVCIIGSDDIYLPDKLQTQIDAFAANDERYGVVYSDVYYINELGVVTGKTAIDEKYLAENTFEKMIEANVIPAMSVLVRKACYDKVGLYDEKLSYEDADMWLRISKEYKFLYSSYPSAQYRKHSESIMYSRNTNISYLESTLLMLSKHLGISEKADMSINSKVSELSEMIYHAGGKRSSRWLRQRWANDKRANSLVLLILSHVGIPGSWVLKAQRALRR